MDKYIPVMTLGTIDRETGEKKEVVLRVKASDIADIPSFARKDISAIDEAPDCEFIPAGTMAVFDPATQTLKPVQLHAQCVEWLDLSIVASEYVTGEINTEQE